MKLTVLTDNNTYIDQYYFGEPAACYYIEDEGEKILLDAGYSDVFIQNAGLMGIDLSTVTTAVVSHGHNDHTRGFEFLIKHMDVGKIRLIAHPDAFEQKFWGEEQIGATISKEQAANRFRAMFSKEPVSITQNITFLGEIPRTNDFENKQPIGKTMDKGKLCDDFLLDDTALVYKSPKGLFIITACSHSGICNIMEYAKEVCGDNRIVGVLGGFHLFDVDERLKKTINYFKKNNVKELYPCHCVAFAVKAEIHKELPIHEVGVGLVVDMQ